MSAPSAGLPMKLRIDSTSRRPWRAPALALRAEVVTIARNTMGERVAATRMPARTRSRSRSESSALNTHTPPNAMMLRSSRVSVLRLDSTRS